MRHRLSLTALLLGLLMVTVAAPADASPRAGGDQHHGGGRLISLAVAQAKQNVRYFHGIPQLGSPEQCSDASSFHGVFLLPTGGFTPGDATFNCQTRSSTALLDLNGFFVTEDDRFGTGTDPDTESFFTLPGGQNVPYSKRYLPLICRLSLDDPSLPGAATATLDGRPLKSTKVTTSNFTVRLNDDHDGSYLDSLNQDAIDLGHPGKLTACYTGYKALVHLSPGRHTVVANRNSASGAISRYVYNIWVRR